jgi:hypothetical protein
MAPYVKKTLADLKQSLADRHDAGTLPTAAATLTFWTRLLNRGVNYCCDKLRLTKSTTLTTASGTIAMPDDFLVINRVFDSSNNEQSQVAQDDLAQHTGSVFWITGNHTDGFYLNSPADKAYTVEYSFKPTELSSDSDICIIPDPEAVVAYAYSFLRRSETDPIGDADTALQECDNRLAELQDANSINNNFSGFVIPDVISTKYSWE